MTPKKYQTYGGKPRSHTIKIQERPSTSKQKQNIVTLHYRTYELHKIIIFNYLINLGEKTNKIIAWLKSYVLIEF